MTENEDKTGKRTGNESGTETRERAPAPDTGNTGRGEMPGNGSSSPYVPPERVCAGNPVLCAPAVRPDPRRTDTALLAYIGDAVYEVMIRSYVIEYVHVKTDRLNRETVEYVKADSQARAMKEILAEDFLTDEERMLVKRARNRTSSSRSRGTGIVQYKLATGLEALVGYLYQAGETERLKEFMREVVRILGTMEERGFSRIK